jgi:trans-aconitate methyltransferase
VTASVIYRSAKLYELAMRVLYGRQYSTRSAVVAELIPDHSSVVDLCCGPGRLYGRHLRQKSVDYTGLDINVRFVEAVERLGGRAMAWDVSSARPLPKAEFVIMQASLYHFLPEPLPVLERMFEAATEGVIIAEPIRNFADSESRSLAAIGRLLTNAGAGEKPLRFTEASLDHLMSTFEAGVSKSFLIPGGREKVFLLPAKHQSK